MIDKIKKWIEDNIHKKWLKVVITIIAIFGVGVCAWFGITSCASFSIDSLKVRTDKVDIETEGVDIKAPDKKVSDLSFANMVLDDLESASNYSELVSVLSSYNLTPDSWSAYLNDHNMVALESEVIYND